MGLAGNDLANGFEIIIMFPPAATTGREVGEGDQGGEKEEDSTENANILNHFKFSCKP